MAFGIGASRGEYTIDGVVAVSQVHVHDLSDEGVLAMWVENPLYKSE